MNDQNTEVFTFDGGIVKPGEAAQFRYSVSETYLGDPIRIPVTIINGPLPGPTAFLSAAIHGDELNGIEVVREVAQKWELSDVCGTIVCLPVLNVQGFTTQERYLPIYDRDLNRAFPGKREGTSSDRIAHEIYRNFVGPCNFGLDFHTSTRGRTTMFHVRADMADDVASRLARAFGTNLIIAGEGSRGMLRRAATDDDIPTITLEMGQAHRSNGISSITPSRACGAASPSTGSFGKRRSVRLAGEPSSKSLGIKRGSGPMPVVSSRCSASVATSSTRATISVESRTRSNQEPPWSRLRSRDSS